MIIDKFALVSIVILFLKGGSMSDSWLLKVQERLKIPEKPQIITNKQWKAFEDQEKVIFPDSFKDFIGIYGCGSINKEVWIVAPMCKITKRETLHMFNLSLHAESQAEEDDANGQKAFDIPSLYPSEDGVYIWGWDTFEKNFSWKMNKSDGYSILKSENVVVFDKFNTYESIENFELFINQILDKRSQSENIYYPI